MLNIIRAAGILLAVGLTGSALADDAADGEAFAKQRCLSCHNREKVVQLASRTPEPERAAKWQKFLASHYVPNEKDRAKVVAWLLQVTRKP
ncbi:MAG: hypothetical protein U1F52_02045 [Burkholderiales bacterium]